MDKTEYHLKLDELTRRVEERDYAAALQIAESIDWRRVKSIRTLSMVADIYEVNRDYRRCKDILLLAFDRASIGKGILYRLTEISLKLGEVDDAVDFYTEYSEVAPNDNSRYILKYKIHKARRAPLADQIAILEEYKEKEYTERWAYELALLYSRAGEQQKAVEACDDLILWFSEGRYVVKAMELKMKYEPLTPSQQQLYDREKQLYSRKERPAAAVPVIPAPAAKAPEASRAAAKARFRKEEKPDSRAVLKKMDRAGAAVTKDAAAEKNAGERVQAGTPAEDYPVTSREFMGKAADLKEQLARSIHDVFSGIRRPAAQDAAAAGAGAAKENIAAQAQAPVQAEAAVQPEDEQIEGQMSLADFDLDALLKETASSLSEEIASDEFRENMTESAGLEETAEEAAEAEAPAEETAEAAEAETPAEETAETVKAEAPAAEEAAETAEAEAPAAEEAAETAEAEAPAAEEAAEAAEAEAPAAEEAAEAAEAEAPAAEEAAEAAEAEAPAAEEAAEAAEAEAPAEDSGKPLYNEELEIPDPEPTPEEKRQRTIPLSKVGQNTIPISIEEVLREETPEERRIRILNDAKPTRMSDEQRRIFTYFARIPGMDQQILEAVGHVYEHAGEHTSRRGNIAVMGAEGTGKTRLTHGLIVAMCQDMGLEAAKTARIKGSALNGKDPARVVAKMSGGFLVIENAGEMKPETVEKLNRAMEFRTDCMVLIIEDEKARMRSLLKKYPEFAGKFDTVISIPVFTNDELVTFARTYAGENGCQMDEMGVLALYTLIGNNQTEEEPVTISQVKEMVDRAMARAGKGSRRRGKRGSGRGRGKDVMVILHEKDFDA